MMANRSPPGDKWHGVLDLDQIRAVELVELLCSRKHIGDNDAALLKGLIVADWRPGWGPDPRVAAGLKRDDEQAAPLQSGNEGGVMRPVLILNRAQLDALSLLDRWMAKGRISDAEHRMIASAIETAPNRSPLASENVEARSTLGDMHTHYAPAVYRGMTGMGSDGPEPNHLLYGLALLTFDRSFNQFVLADLDLKRLGRDIGQRFPHFDFGQDSGLMARHSETSDAFRRSSSTADGSQAEAGGTTRPDSNASRAS